MKNLIDKSAVMAEIEKRREAWKYGSSIEAKYKKEECDDILSSLDTLEVKEVDLEYEQKYKQALEKAKKLYGKYCIDNVLEGLFPELKEKETNQVIEPKFKVDLEKEIEFIKGDYEQVDVAWNNDFDFIAKHFYELGLKANCPITANDRGMAEEIIINLKRVEKDYRIDLTKEIEWLRNKTKKGE